MTSDHLASQTRSEQEHTLFDAFVRACMIHGPQVTLPAALTKSSKPGRKASGPYSFALPGQGSGSAGSANPYAIRVGTLIQTRPTKRSRAERRVLPMPAPRDLDRTEAKVCALPGRCASLRTKRSSTQAHFDDESASDGATEGRLPCPSARYRTHSSADALLCPLSHAHLYGFTSLLCVALTITIGSVPQARSPARAVKPTATLTD